MTVNKHKAHANPIRILHVDDDSSFLEISRTILNDTDEDLIVDSALSVDDAFSKLALRQYDVIISDYEMPNKNGLDFFRELRAKNNKLPFILFTGKGREEIAIQALNLGADGYFNKHGNPETVYGELIYGIKNISERKKTKLALEESEIRCQTLMQQANEMIFIHDSKGRFVYTNSKACKNLGYSEEELCQMSVVDVDSNATESGLAALWPKVLAGENFSFETLHKCKDGSVYPVEVSLSLIKFSDQQFVMGFAKNISERKKIEDKLRESEERYRNIVELSPDGIVVANLKGKILMVNKAFEDLSGFSREEIVGKHFTKLGTLRASDMPRYIKLYLDLLRDKKCPSIDFVYMRKDGILRDAEAHFALMKKDGKKTGFQVILKDITDFKNKENETRLFSNLFELVNDSITVCDFEGNIVYFNEAACKIRGYTRDEMAKMSLFSLNPSESYETVKKRLGQVIDKGSIIFETENIRKDSTRVSLEVHSSIINLDEKKLILAVSRDITERKKAEDRLKETENHYRLLAENSKDSLWTMDLGGRFTYISPSVYQLRGYTPEEAVKQSLIETLTPESAQKIIEVFQKYRTTGEIPKKNFELEALCKDGSTVWIEVTFSLFVGKAGEPAIIFGASRDISERKKAEEKIRESQRQLEIVNEKLHVVGSLTRHDIRNKLMIAKNNIYLLKKKVQVDPEGTKFLCAVEESLAQSDELFKFTRLYEQIGAEKLRNLCVADEFSAALTLRPHEGIEIINDAQGLTVLADSMLQQLFYNLIDNSLKHGKKVNTIKLRYEQDNKQIRIIYEDNGVGHFSREQSENFLGGVHYWWLRFGSQAC